jgi:hypothetical protein
LVRGPGQVAPVVAVLHHAVNAVHCVAAADLDAVSAAARGQRLYVPTFASPDDNDVIYRYDNALGPAPTLTEVWSATTRFKITRAPAVRPGARRCVVRTPATPASNPGFCLPLGCVMRPCPDGTQA